MCACLSAQAGVQSPIRRTLPPWIPAFELVNLSVSSRDQHRASFETAASRLPQDEVFLNAIKEVPHPEEAQGAVSKDAGCLCSSYSACLVGARRNCGSVMSSFSFSKTTSTRRPTFASV